MKVPLFSVFFVFFCEDPSKIRYITRKKTQYIQCDKMPIQSVSTDPKKQKKHVFFCSKERPLFILVIFYFNFFSLFALTFWIPMSLMQ